MKSDSRASLMMEIKALESGAQGGRTTSSMTVPVCVFPKFS